MNHCECNMNCDPHLTTRIKHVYGNVLRLAIPLTLRSLMKDGDTIVATDSDFIPSSEYPVNVVFGKGNKNIAIPAEMDGNVAIIEERGKMPVGTYDITVECRDDLGQPYRFKKDTVLQVVDVTAEAGIEPTIEYEAQTWYLDAAVFLATTEIGSMGEEIERRLEDVFGDVDYDAENKVIKFYNKNKTHVLGTLDSTPFVVDGTVDDVYIDVSRQVLVVILNEDAGGRRFSVPLYLVFDNYYKKDEVDSKVDHKADVLGDGRIPGAEATPVVLDYIYAPASGSPIIPINPQAGEVIYFANEHKIRRYYYEYAGQSGGLPAIVYVEETPSRYVVYYNKRDEKFYRYDAASLSMVEIETGSGGGDGTVTGVKVGDTTYEPTNGVVDISAGIPDVSGFVTAGDVADAVADLVNSAPATLDTLKELSDALGDDPNFATTMTTALGNKVDKVTGKGLSTEDYTTAEKSKLAGLSNYDDTALQTAIAGKVDKETGKSLMTDAERTKLSGIASGAEANVQADWEQTTTTADDYIKNKPDVPTSISVNQQSFPLNNNHAFVIPDYYTKTQMDTALAGKQDTIDDLATIRSGAAAGTTAVQQSLLADVAISGDYSDLDNKPTIPTKFSDLVDDSDYIKAEDVASIVVGSADVVITETPSHICITFVTSSITFSPDTTMSLYAGQKTGTLTVSGTHLKQDITLTVPANFTAQVSGGTAAQSITIPQTGGEVTGVSVTITYTGADSGSYNGSITATSGSATASVGLVYSQYQGAMIIAGTISTIKATMGGSQVGELNVSGVNLEGDITASVGSGDFTICATQNGTYGTTATISKASAEAAGGATLYVKYTPSSGTSTASGTLTLSTPKDGSTTTESVSLSGKVAGTLSITPSTGTIGIASGGSGTTQFTVQGTYLTPASTAMVSVSGTGMSADKQTLTVGQDGTINEVVTVTFSGSADSNGTLTVSHTDVDNAATASIAGVITTPLPVGAEFQVGKLKYKVLSGQSTVSVAQISSSVTTGDIVIPSTVNDSGVTATLTDSSTQLGVGCTYTVTTIASSGFTNNNNITSLVLPNTITTIGVNGIRELSNNGMTSFVIPDSVTSISANNLFKMTKLTSLTIGSGVTVLPDYFMGSCDALHSITIPNNITEIKTYAFTNSTYYTDVDLGSGLTKIGNNTSFRMADDGVVTIRYTGGVISIGGLTFKTQSGGYPTTATLYVPSSLVDTYKTAPGFGVNNNNGWHMFDPNNIYAIQE